MADFGFQSGMAAYQMVRDEPARQEQVKSQTDLLSTRAAEAKMSLEEKRDIQRTTMSARAASNKAQLDNLQIDSTSLKGVDQIYDVAIKNTMSHPEVQESLRAKKAANLQEMATLSTQQSKMQGEQAEEKSRVVTESLFNPEVGVADIKALGERTGDKQLIGLGMVLSGQVPVPKKYTDGATLSYNQLSPAQRDALHTSIRSSFPGGKVEKTAHDIQQEITASVRAEEQKKRDEEKARNDVQVAAAKREGLIVSEELKRAQLDIKEKDLEIKKTQQIGVLEKRMGDLPETIKNPKSTMWNTEPSHIPNPAIERIQKQIDKLEGVKDTTKAPEDQKIAQTVIAHGWSYEPTKYDYRIDSDGKPQRKLKE